ncbi:MAG: HD domain-containing protein [Planctomycetota bacterium]|nr:MAG: HD domain-containing protein [Planctomycetota bacterium]
MLKTVDKKLSLPQSRELKKFAGRVNKFGVNFAFCVPNGELALLRESGKFQSDEEQLIKAGQQALSRNNKAKGVVSEVQIFELDKGAQVLAAVLKSDNDAVGVALIDLRENTTRSDNKVGTEKEKYGPREILREMLSFLAENFRAIMKAEKQIEMVSTKLAQTYEELVLLHKLSTNMKVTEADAIFLQMACDGLTEIVNVEGIAILLEKMIDGEKRLSLAAGLGLIDIDEQMGLILKKRLTEEINKGNEALLDSEVDSPFKYEWSNNIKNIIGVPLWGKEKTGGHFVEKGRDGSSIIGLMVAINRLDKPDFDSTDVKLFNSVANGCAVFVDNGRLFKDLEELFIGSLRALTSSIDAKDPYTRGHSERVAFISRWIAERITEGKPLEKEQIHKIYLSGLLHDIGKMGIDEAVLRKKGKLTDRELNQMRMHPSIGAAILSEIKQMRDIVPGVLHHHERADGKGYPGGLTAEQTPLTGKIIGLADSFDAMTSKRTYRNAMTIEQALVEIEKGLGTQFDQQVGRIFINSDIYQLWDIMQAGFSEIYGDSTLSEYGTAAVGSIIR